MEYFEDLLKNESELPEKLPDWVNRLNASYPAWKLVKRIKAERLSYISKHLKPSDYRVKKAYQISGSEIAKEIGISKVTLLSTSTYSNAFKGYLTDVNAELAKAKEMRIAKTRISKSRGPIAKNKDELVEETKHLKEEISVLEQRNAVEQIEKIIDSLQPDIDDLLFVKQKNGKCDVHRIKPNTKLEGL